MLINVISPSTSSLLLAAIASAAFTVHGKRTTTSVYAEMVIGLLAIAAIPTVTGVGQGISVQKKQNAAAKEQEKFHLTAMMPMDGELREAAFCVLLDGKVRTSMFPGSHPRRVLILLFAIAKANRWLECT